MCSFVLCEGIGVATERNDTIRQRKCNKVSTAMPILKHRGYCSYAKRDKTDKMIINMPVRFRLRLSQRNTTTGKYISLTSHIGQMIFISCCFLLSLFVCVCVSSFHYFFSYCGKWACIPKYLASNVDFPARYNYGVST